MGMSAGGNDGGGMSEINVTPLIDIMLVMLIIFMIITPPTLSQMAAKLPEQTEEVPEDDVPQDQLVAAVCEDGAFALNKKKMTLEELAEQVERRLKGKDTKVVFVDGHPDANYEQMVQMMDTIRESGAARLGIASLKEGEDFRACSPAPAAPVIAPDGAPPAPPTAG
jgi:biopolymer transport protein ExbD